MSETDETVRITLSASQIENIVTGVNKRREGSDQKFLFGAERVDIRYYGNMKFVAKKNDFDLFIDEPSDRGGTNAGPNPLAYFLTGCASCLMMQYVRLAIAGKIPIASFELSARGYFNRNVGGAFTEIIYDVEIKSSEEPSKIIALSKEAERFCYAHNTLLKAGVKMTTNLKLNDHQIAALSHAAR